MYTKELDNKILHAVRNGSITEEDRENLQKEAEEYGIDSEELDVVIDGCMYLAKNGINYQHNYQKLGKIITPSNEDFDNDDLSENDASNTYNDGKDFNLGMLLNLLRHNKILMVIVGVVLLIICWPLIQFLLLLLIVSVHPSSEDSTLSQQEKNTVAVSASPKKTEKTEITETTEATPNSDELTESTDENVQESSEDSDIPGYYPEASERLLTDADLASKSKLDLKFMRNEIYARHGYIFKTAEMKEHFEHEYWYVGQYKDVSSMLTSIEKKNVELIKKYENR